MRKNFLQSLLRKKDISLKNTDHENSLNRILGPWQLVALGTGVTIGAGIFSLTGIASGLYAGPAVTISFFIAAIACSFAGLCYAELAGMMPNSAGSAYSYAYASMGEAIAWIIGWDLVLEYTVNAAAVASSWTGYMAALLNGWGIYIDPRLLASPMTPVKLSNGTIVNSWINLPSIIIIFFVMIMLIKGIKGSTKFNTTLVILKIVIIISVIALCLPVINPSNYIPFIPKNTGNFGEFGISGIMRAAGMVFFSYIGFDIVATTSRDTKNPQKNICIGILGTLIFCTLIYCIFSLVIVGVIPFKTMAHDPNPVASVMDAINHPIISSLIKFGISIGYISVIYGLLLGQSRVSLSMSEDGLIPALFSKLSKNSKTPIISLILTSFITALLSSCLPLNILSNMTSIGTLLAFIIVCTGVMILRYKASEVTRNFYVPGGNFFIPISGIISCGAVILSMDSITWMRLIIWLIIGSLFYCFYGYYHSKLNKK